MNDQRVRVIEGRVPRRRCHRSITPSASKMSKNGTRMGTSTAASDNAADDTSSSRDRGGPSKATFATGRTVALVAWTVPAIAPPASKLAITATPELIEV